jgi:hypothetical protein
VAGLLLEGFSTARASSAWATPSRWSSYDRAWFTGACKDKIFIFTTFKHLFNRGRKWPRHSVITLHVLFITFHSMKLNAWTLAADRFASDQWSIEMVCARERSRDSLAQTSKSCLEGVPLQLVFASQLGVIKRRGALTLWHLEINCTLV